ncbi:MAG: hypothetical protein ACHP7O_06615 [Burkholderiales bacterium]
MRQFRVACFIVNIAIVSLLCTGTAWGAPVELSDDELAEVRGQGLITLDNTTSGGFNFSTITLNSSIALNANLQNILLGQNNLNGPGADIDIPALQFGTGGTATTATAVQITNPYLEFIYNASGNQVIGMRLGFEGISGTVGLLMNTVSGALQIADGAGDALSSIGSRSTSLTCTGTSCAGGALSLSAIGGVSAGTTAAPSRDFWVSLLSQAVQFPAQPGLSAPNVAQAGVWLNWTDRLTALNTTGTVPNNVVLAMLRHK